MTFTVTLEERDALYEQVVLRAEAFDDLLLALGKEDFAAADRLAWEHTPTIPTAVPRIWGQALQASIVTEKLPSAVTARTPFGPR